MLLTIMLSILDLLVIVIPDFAGVGTRIGQKARDLLRDWT